MFRPFYPFGYEIQYLNESIETATHKQYNLANKRLIKRIIRIIGLPHFGARLRAYHLNKLIKDLPSTKKILDAGCGIGLYSFLFVRKGHRVIGVDNDSKKIYLARKILKDTGYKNVNFKVSDLTKTTLRDNSFDAAICFEVLEHIKEDEKAISNITKALKRNGMLFLSVPGKGIISKINQACKDHVREGYSFSQLQTMLKKQHLAITKIVKIEHTPLGFLLRYINDEIGRRSLLIVTLLFPLFFPLAVLDSFLPEIITPNNWIIVAKKTIDSPSGGKNNK